MSDLQPNCCLKFDFQKVDQHVHGFGFQIHKLNHSREFTIVLTLIQWQYQLLLHSTKCVYQISVRDIFKYLIYSRNEYLHVCLWVI